MGESEHKRSALESCTCELPAFERFVVIWGESHPSTQLREGLFYSAELRTGVCVF